MKTDKLIAKHGAMRKLVTKRLIESIIEASVCLVHVKNATTNDSLRKAVSTAYRQFSGYEISTQVREDICKTVLATSAAIQTFLIDNDE